MITNVEIGVPMVVHGMTRGKKERGSNRTDDQGQTEINSLSHALEFVLYSHGQREPLT